MRIKENLQKITEAGFGFIAIVTLLIAGCGGGGGGGGGNQSTSGLVSTFAGGTQGYSDGIGTAAQFQAPANIASDGNGNLYIADLLANNIRKIVISTGQVTTFAGSTTGASGVLDATGTLARFNQPMGITSDGTNLYVTDFASHTIRKIVISTQDVTTLAGSAGATGWTDAASGTPATSARFSFPWGICRIGTSLFVADSYSTVRKIDVSGASAVVSTIAGSPATYGYTNSLTGASAVFHSPTSISTDGTSLFVTEFGNNDVRKVNAITGATSLVAGGNYLLPTSGVGSADGIESAARFNDPRGIASDGNGNLYVADTFNNTIRKVNLSGASAVVSTLAGAPLSFGNSDGVGTSARFSLPTGIIYINGVLYIADYANRSIRKIQL
jgi:hypothetical protein